MMIATITLATLCGLAVAQFENGIQFSERTTTKTPAMNTQSTLASLIINNDQTCNCVLIGTCSTKNGIDIRIVNMEPSCPSGYMACCTSSMIPSQPTTKSPPIPACGIRKIQPIPQPIVGQASFGAYPWQAAIINKTGQNFIGSGVLMDATHIVTTAHKVADYVNKPDKLIVRLGDWDGRSTGTANEPYGHVNVNVAQITIHPNFNSVNLDNDVAVIRLNGVVPISSYPNINTACRPTGPAVANQRCYVSGWGKNAFAPNGQYQSIMKEVDVPIIDANTCESRLRQTRLGANFVLSRNNFICAGGEAGKDACTGDGGSPLVCPTSTGQWQVVGLVAWGIGCANAGVPGVYTNFWNFLPWINQVIASA